MKLRGGHNILLAGRPSSEVRVPPAPSRLLLPLRSPRFHMSEMRAEDGRKVDAGDVLASDPGSFGIPLVAPRAGTVRLDAVEGHVVLEDLEPLDEAAVGQPLGHVEAKRSDPSAKRHALLELGAWQFFSDAHSGAPLDPSSTPGGIIVRRPRVVRPLQGHRHLGRRAGTPDRSAGDAGRRRCSASGGIRGRREWGTYTWNSLTSTDPSGTISTPSRVCFGTA